MPCRAVSRLPPRRQQLLEHHHAADSDSDTTLDCAPEIQPADLWVHAVGVGDDDTDNGEDGDDAACEENRPDC